MQIKINWGTGWMEVTSDHVIRNMSMSQYRTWVKLFAKYGSPEQHCEFLTLLDKHADEIPKHKKMSELLRKLIS